MKTKHFINLTNGIQAIEDYSLTEYHFIRIQSTACEQKRWNQIILDLSDDFLMFAALGHKCIIYDYGANKATSRAIWQGVEWVRYVLYRRWYGEYIQLTGRLKSSEKYFNSNYLNLTKQVKKKLDYFKPYLVGGLNIVTISSSTKNDGNKEYYSGVLKNEI